MGNTAMCKLLLKCSDYHLDIDCINSVRDTMLHVACASSDIELTELLLRSKQCAVNLQNNKGQTSLHLACKGNTAASLQIVHLLLYCGKRCDTAIKDSNGDTPLHYACREANAAVAQLLIGTEGCEVNSQNAEGKTPLHEACMCFGLESADVVKTLLTSSKYCDVNCEDDYGSTPLHYACECGQLQNVKLLLSTGDIDPMLPDGNGRTPFQITPNFGIIQELSKYISYSTTHPVEPFVKVFVIGNHAAGKSTLVKVLTEKASRLRKFMPHYWNMVYSVESPTAGVIPVRLQSKQFGNVILYDFAGQSQYYSSHSAIIENAISSSAPVFIIVVNLFEDVESIAKSVQFWLGFIENHCSQVPVQPHVIAVGSHVDLVKENLQQKSALVRRLFEQSEALHFVGFVALDCRLLASVDLNTFRSLLATSCSALRDSTTVSLGCHILTAFLQEKFQSTSTVACKVKDVLSVITRENVVLPQSSGKLLELLSTLHEREQILLLQSSEDPLNSWVVFDKAVLLSQVNGSLFAPKNFRQHRDYANSTGVVPLSKIKWEFPQYDPEMITSFLILLEFCQVISDPATLTEIQDVTNVHQQEPNSLQPETTALGSHFQRDNYTSLVPQKQPNAVPINIPNQTSGEIDEEADSRREEQYYFFPALVGIEKPEGIWAVCDIMVHKFGWCLQCINAGQFLSSRFLHVMLLRLAFQFALPLKKTRTLVTEKASPVLTRRCRVWKNGIHWLDQSGCEVLVELGKHNQRVILMMRHKPGGEVLSAKLRSAIIKAILKTKTRFCLNVKMNEYLIHPADLQYPITDEPKLFVMKEIVESITDPYTKPEVIDCSGSLSLSVKQLLGFEPFVGVSRSLLEQFYSKDSDPELVLHNLAEETSSNAAFFQQVISPRSGRIQECNVLFQMWFDQSVRSAPLGRFRQEIFDDYSILCGRNPIDLLTGGPVQATMAPEVRKPDVTVASSKVLSLQSYTASNVETTLTIDALSEVNTTLVSITDWYRLGVTLAIPSHHLDVIQANHHKDVTRCLTEVLAGWLQKQGNAPSLKTLVHALKHLGKLQLAANVTRTLAATRQDEGEKTPHSTVDNSHLGETSLREVEQEVSTVGRRWFHLGLALGLSYNRLETTEVDNPGDCHSSLIRVLQAWLKGQDRVMERGHPSWRALVIALESPLVSKPAVANMIAISHTCQHS